MVRCENQSHCLNKIWSIWSIRIFIEALRPGEMMTVVPDTSRQPFISEESEGGLSPVLDAYMTCAYSTWHFPEPSGRYRSYSDAMGSPSDVCGEPWPSYNKANVHSAISISISISSMVHMTMSAVHRAVVKSCIACLDSINIYSGKETPRLSN